MTFRIWHALHLLLAMAAVVQESAAQDRRRYDHEAAAALALAAVKEPAPARSRAAPEIAPAPREKTTAQKTCPCCVGNVCTCCGSPDCPAKCEPKEKREIVVPSPMPAPVKVQPQIIGYRYEQRCFNGQCFLVQVPVYR